VQTTGLAPVQVPDWQVSVRVQALPSLHVDPLALAGFEQTPVEVLQTPGAWHWSGVAQTTGLPPVQLPDWQVSVCVHALLSLQLVPLGLDGFEQTPVDGLHVPATWHWSDAVQTIGLPLVQLPAWQVSDCVHALPSLQVEPLGLAGSEQTPFAGLHVPATWHWSDAVQTTGLAPVQIPD